MDRSFLSHDNVVKASRNFICVRLATYENPLENVFLKNLVRTGSGELENSAFAIFAPNGKDKLVRSARGPQNVFADSNEMAKKLEVLAATYSGKQIECRTLPVVDSVKLGLIVAAADSLPLVILNEDQTNLTELAKLAWSTEYVGRFIYAVAKTPEDWKRVGNENSMKGIAVVQPETFGREGKILAAADSTDGWAQALNQGLKNFQRNEKTSRTHLKAGREAGVFYEPATPVTDPMELKARERMKSK
jgi:hypothetical protein